MQDPATKAVYKKIAGDKAFSNPFAAALRDYLVAPIVMDVDAREFNGAAGSTIPVKVSDIFKTIRISVVLVGADGMIESGEASFTHGDVEYITTQVLPSLSGAKIVVTASIARVLKLPLRNYWRSFLKDMHHRGTVTNI